MVISKWIGGIFCIALTLTFALSITSAIWFGSSLADIACLKDTVSDAMSELGMRLDVLEQNHISTESVPTIQESSSNDNEYLILAEGDKICVYATTGDLIYVLKISIHMLPQKDRELLENGIKVQSRGELIRILQDYSA